MAQKGILANVEETKRHSQRYLFTSLYTSTLVYATEANWHTSEQPRSVFYNLRLFRIIKSRKYNNFTSGLISERYAGMVDNTFTEIM